MCRDTRGHSISGTAEGTELGSVHCVTMLFRAPVCFLSAFPQPLRSAVLLILSFHGHKNVTYECASANAMP